MFDERGVEQTSEISFGDLLDDDAVPHWTLEEKDLPTLYEIRSLGRSQSGHRDLLKDHPELRAVEPLTERVGVLPGMVRRKVIHRGKGSAHHVHALKGEIVLRLQRSTIAGG